LERAISPFKTASRPIDPREPEVEPYIWHTFIYTLGRRCCSKYLPTCAEPAEALDYYLSKLYQFLYLIFSAAYGGDFESPSLYRLICAIPRDSAVPQEAEQWYQIWIRCLDTACRSDCQTALNEFEGCITALGARRKPGRRPEPDRNRVLAELTYKYGPDWQKKENLSSIRKALAASGLNSNSKYEWLKMPDENLKKALTYARKHHEKR